jgi:hypothetical protein
MRKIKILMAIFLSLFVMVILQSCEKESVDVTEQEPELEQKEEIITADKLLEREGAVRLHLQRNWGTYYITDEYTDVTLADGYYIKDIYTCSTNSSRSVYERISGCVLVPVDLNMGYPDEYTEDYLKEHPDKRRYRVFLVLDIKRSTDGMSGVEEFAFASPAGPGKLSSNDPKLGENEYSSYLPSDRWISNKSRLSFDEYKCNLNRGTDGDFIYLMYKKGRGERNIRALRVTYSTNEAFAKNVHRNGGFTYHGRNMNENNKSPVKIYLGWRYY